MDIIIINLDPIIRLTDEQFYQLCMANQDVNFELNAKRQLIILPPRGGEIEL